MITLSSDKVKGICQTGLLSYTVTIIDEDGITCPCLKAMDTGIPWAHAFSIFSEVERMCKDNRGERLKTISLANHWDVLNPKYFEPSGFLVENYVNQYKAKCPGVTVEELEERELIPWHVLHKSGKKRFTSAPTKTSYKCSLCGSMGHNSSSCTRPCREKILEDVKKKGIDRCIGADEDCRYSLDLTALEVDQ